MRKSNKLVLVIVIVLMIVMALSAFVACKKKDGADDINDVIDNIIQSGDQGDNDGGNQGTQGGNQGSQNGNQGNQGNQGGTQGGNQSDPQVSVTFYSNNVQVAATIDIESAKEILASQPAREGYVFKGWYLDNGTWEKEITSSNVEEAVKDDVNVYAYWVEIIDLITVRFLDYTGAELLKKDYERSDDQLERDLATLRPSNYSDEQYTYTFEQWNCDVSDETQSSYVATPTYTRELRIFEVNYYVDGELYYTQYVKYGYNADLSAVTQPVKPSDGVFKFEFAGWTGNLENITANTGAHAQFNEIYIQIYTVLFINWDGTTLDTVKVESGEAAVYGGATPMRESNEMYDYTFAGWSLSKEEADLDNVTCNFVATAGYSESIRTYTITFTDDNDDVIKVLEAVPYGTDLRTSTTFSLPTDEETAMDSTNQYEYTFIDWDQYLSRVYGDMTVKAMYTKTLRRYIIKFVSNGVAISTQEVAYGEYPTMPTIATVMNDTAKWAFDFLGWQVIGVDTTLPGSGEDIDSDDGTDLRTTLLSADGSEFLEPANNMVEGEITYTAIFSRTIQQYIIRFFNDKDYLEFLTEITVPWGTNVIGQALVADPTKDSVPKWDYKFNTWNRNDDLKKIVGSFDVYAEYLSILRYYTVTYMDGENVYKEYSVAYDDCAPLPEIPTKLSTLEFDFEFKEWDRSAERVIEGDTIINAVYNNNLRSYTVSLFNLSTYELISTGEFNYGTKITTKINVSGFDFDSWYRDPDCATVFNQDEEYVDGPMMLFGNIVMQGFDFNDDNAITGYHGVSGDLIIPIAANGRQVNTIKEKAFDGNTTIESVYIPNTITKVEAYAFANIDISETGSIYVQSEKGKFGIITTTKPSGWSNYWNWNSLTSDNNKNYWDGMILRSYDTRPTVFGVNGIFTVGNYQYMLFSDGVAYVDKFVNASTSTAYIASSFVHELASFSTETWEDPHGTGETRLLYTTDYTESAYNITQISLSAFEGCTNLNKIFVPTTITRINNYAFSGLTADIYIAKSKPLSEELAWSVTGTSKWNNHRNGQSGNLNIVWNVVGMDSIGDFSYIFQGDGTAILAEYFGKSTATSLDIPGTVTYQDVDYTVVEIADELFTNMSGLRTVTIGEGVKKMGKKMFYMDIFLSSVTLPSTLTEIGEQEFMFCSSLNQIYIPANVTKIGSLAFIGIDNLTIYCGNTTTLVGTAPVGYALGWNTKIGFRDLGDLDLSSIMSSISTITSKFTQTHDVIWNVAGLPQVDKVTPTLSALPGEYTYLLYNDGHAELIASNIPTGSFNTSYTIPEAITYNGVDYKVTTITATAFAGNTRIKELIIPTTVTTIPAGAFEGCSSLSIKTAYTERPSGWKSGFDTNGDSTISVTWGYGVESASEEAA